MPQVKIGTAAFWGRILAGNALASIAVMFAFSNVTLSTPLPEILKSFGISMLFSCCIAVLLGTSMPRLGPWIFERLSFPFNWIAAAAVMVVLGLTGSVVALALLTALGVVPAADFTNWLAGGFRITIVMTLTIGLFIMAYEMMRKRLDDATLALRTTERDEAEARRVAVEAQLASLESRVQPHFLFNTLNSIAALVHDDPAGAERMTGQLASLLRSALDSTAVPLVPLDEELRVVRAYLDIERVRFGDRLRYDVALEDGTASALVPRMALQTLVENSVKYAVSPRREGGSIRVTAAALNGHVRVTVADDGPGFDAAQRPEGHGLALLDARLAMLFGDRAAMRVDSRAGHTDVTIDVPASSAASAAPAEPAASAKSAESAIRPSGASGRPEPAEGRNPQSAM